MDSLNINKCLLYLLQVHIIKTWELWFNIRARTRLPLTYEIRGPNAPPTHYEYKRVIGHSRGACNLICDSDTPHVHFGRHAPCTLQTIRYAASYDRRWIFFMTLLLAIRITQIL
jgi:hypothetical protein